AGRQSISFRNLLPQPEYLDLRSNRTGKTADRCIRCTVVDGRLNRYRATHLAADLHRINEQLKPRGLPLRPLPFQENDRVVMLGRLGETGVLRQNIDMDRLLFESPPRRNL